MINLYLHPHGGHNASGRYYPHTGYLGVTPVTLSGTVQTKCSSPAHTLHASSVSVSVRCYEIRATSSFLPETEHTLWQKSKTLWTSSKAGDGEGDDYTELGDWDHPFRITVPADAVPAACSSQWLMGWRVAWKLEVTIHHRPIPYVGNALAKAYALNLYNHRQPILPPPSPPSAVAVGSDSTLTQIFITSPTGAYGPSDTFTVAFHAKPEDGSTLVKKATATLCRKIEGMERASPGRTPRTMSPENNEPRPLTASSSSSAGSSSRFALWRRSVSPRPRDRTPSDTPSNPYASLDAESSTSSLVSSGRVDTLKLLEVSCDEPTPGSGGTYWCSMPVTLPKRHGRWDFGETVQTERVAVSFELRVKVWLKSSKSRGAGSKEYILPGIPIVLVATSQEERAAALQAASSPSPSVSTGKSAIKRKHRSSRRGLYMHEGTTDISDPVVSGRQPRRSRTKSLSASPVIPSAPMPAVATDVKPILLLPDQHRPQAQSISFVFPSPPPHGSADAHEGYDDNDEGTVPTITILPNINALINHSVSPPPRTPVPPFSFREAHPPPLSPPPTHPRSDVFALPSVPTDSPPPPPYPPLPPSGHPFARPAPLVLDAAVSPTATHLSPLSPASPYESFSILRQFQQSGRRISTTTSEEDEVQPSRSRQKTGPDPDPRALFDLPQAQRGGRGLPSLDALGLGLPHVPEDAESRRRPRTAPVFRSGFEIRATSAGKRSGGDTISRQGGSGEGPELGLRVPPPLSGGLSMQSQQGRPMEVEEVVRVRPVTSMGGGFGAVSGAGGGGGGGTKWAVPSFFGGRAKGGGGGGRGSGSGGDGAGMIDRQDGEGAKVRGEEGAFAFNVEEVGGK